MSDLRTQREPLSAPLERLVKSFHSDKWRERKHAVESLSQLIQEGEVSASELETLIESLIDLLEDGDALSARAACHEILVMLGARALRPLVQRIEAGKEEGKRLMVDLIGVVGGASEVPLLRSILEDPKSDENLQASAATALGEIGGSKAVAVITELLDAESEMLRVYGLDALRRAGAIVPVEKLSGLVDSPVTKKATAALLGSSRSERALPLLGPLLADPRKGVRSSAVESLCRLHGDLGEEGRGTLVADTVRGMGNDAVAAVREALREGDHEACAAGLRLAGMLRDGVSLEVVLGRMDDPVIFERTLELVEALGEDANAVLLRMLEGEEQFPREPVFRLLAGAHPTTVDPQLLSLAEGALPDPDPNVGCAAADALKRLGRIDAIDGLHQCCKREGALGEHAAEALAEVVLRSGPRGHESLARKFREEVWPQEGAFARNLCRVVGRLGSKEYVTPLVSMLGSPESGIRVAAAQALGTIDGEQHEGMSALCFALADENHQVRTMACRSLGHLKDPGSCQPLLSATVDPLPVVRAAAVQALITLDNPVTLARMREIVHEDPSPSVVVQAIAGLASSQQNQDLLLLMSLCASEDPEVVKAAARALTYFSAHRATAALLGLLSHPRWDVRWAAVEVLAERGDTTAIAPLQTAREGETDDLVGQLIEQVTESLIRLSGGDPRS